MADETDGNMLGFLNFDQLSETLAQVEQEQAAVRAANRQAAAVAVQQRNKILESTTNYVKSAEQAQSELDQIKAQRTESHRLRDGGFGERLELIGQQMINPQAYTRDGRRVRVNEVSEQLQFEGQIHNVRVTHAAAVSAAAQARAAHAATSGASTLAKLKKKTAVLNTLNANHEATERYRENTLAQQPISALEQAMTLEPDDRGLIQIGEVQYEPHEVKQAFRNREEAALLSQIPLDATNSQAVNAMQTVMARRSSLADLENAIDNPNENGWPMLNGQAVDPAIVQSALTEKKDQFDQRVAARVASGIAATGLERMQQQAVNQIELLQEKHLPGTPMGNASQKYLEGLDAMEQVVQAAADSGQPVTRVQQMQILAQINTELIEAVGEEAKRMAGTDKELEPILRDQLLGKAPDPTMVLDYAAERFSQGKGIARVFPDTVSSELQRDAEQMFRGTMSQFQEYDQPSMTETKLIRDRSFRDAYDNFLQKESTRVVSAMGQRAPYIQGHPVQASGISPGDYTLVKRNAQKAASQAVMNNLGITQEEFDAVANGDPASAGVSEQMAADIRNTYNLSTVIAEYEELENQKVGLGAQTVAWLRQNAQSVAQETLGLMPLDSANMISGSVDERVRESLMLWNEADRSAPERREQLVVDKLLQLSRPEVEFPVLLKRVTDITGQDKVRIWEEFVAPVFDDARKRGLGADESVALVQQVLSNGAPNDAALNRAMATLVRALPKVRTDYREHATALREMLVQTAIGQQAGAPTQESKARANYLRAQGKTEPSKMRKFLLGE